MSVRVIPVFRWIAVGGLVALSLVFLYTGFLKLEDPGAFERTLAAHQVIPSGWLGAAARGTAGLELAAGVLGLGLLAQSASRFVGVVSIGYGAIFILFTAYAAVAWMKVGGVGVIPEEGCGCGVPVVPGADLWSEIVARDSVMAVILGLIAIGAVFWRGFEKESEGPGGLGSTAL